MLSHVTNTLVEWDADAGQYDMRQERAIVEHRTLGRLLIVQGFGGGDVEGHCYRWRHGIAVKLLPTDTLASLAALPDEHTYTSPMQRILGGYDEQRPLAPLSGDAISAIALSCQI